MMTGRVSGMGVAVHQTGKELSMRTTLLGFAVSTLVAFLALGCGGSGLGLGAEGGSGGNSSGVGGSGGQESGRYGGMSGSGGLQAGGMTSPGQGAGGCLAYSCPAVECPEGSVVVHIECADCKDTCDCPCPCWACDFGTGGTVSSGGTSGSSGMGGTISHGGVSGRSGSGGFVSLGGVSGSSWSGVGGASGSGGSRVTCIMPPCPPPQCPDGYIVAPSNDCDCSGPCGCPCGCWTCVPPSGPPDAATRIDAPVSDGPSTVGDAKVPLQHRSTSASCPSQRGPAPQDCTTGTCTGQPYPSQVSGLPLTCSSDSQCTAGVNGRCFPPKPEWAGGCSYDECFADSSCGARTPCICRTSSTNNSANVCDVGGNCAVDSDCGLGGYCSPSMESCASTDPNIKAEASNGPSPYYCHTASDLCINDSDCGPPDAATTPFPALNVCAYSTQDNRWECTTITCGHF